MLKALRHNVIKSLLVKFYNETPHLKLIDYHLHNRGLFNLCFDHFAIIDLPSAHTGIPQLSQLFSSLGYVRAGSDYLAEKQNDFVWLVEEHSQGKLADKVLPQVVVADFRLDEMPTIVQKIIKKYTTLSAPCPLTEIQHMLSPREIAHASDKAIKLILNYLQGRDWPLPTRQEFSTVYEFNPLLGWVLLFGRRPNHFTLAIHLLTSFSDLNTFLTFIEQEVGLAINAEGSKIKGNRRLGIEQAATLGSLQSFKLPGGKINIASEFVEFIWRHPISATTPARYWQDYQSGFFAQNANRVIESLTSEDRSQKTEDSKSKLAAENSG